MQARLTFSASILPATPESEALVHKVIRVLALSGVPLFENSSERTTDTALFVSPHDEPNIPGEVFANWIGKDDSPISGFSQAVGGGYENERNSAEIDTAMKSHELLGGGEGSITAAQALQAMRVLRQYEVQHEAEGAGSSELVRALDGYEVVVDEREIKA